MPKITSTIWKIDPHTEAKHAILKKYLNAWLPIITRWNGRVLYIDGFAGPGEYIGGKKGSPIIAIQSVMEHKASLQAEIIMLFIESDKNRCDFLRSKIQRIEVPSNIRIKCECTKFDEKLTTILDIIDAQKTNLAPAFVFVDPFGFTGFPFSLIKRLMQNKKCEVLITFMYEEINRFISDKRLWDTLKNTFGTDRWKEVIDIKDPKQRRNTLHNIYRNQLEQNAEIKYVRSFEMINKANKTDYFLFFGSNSITGLKKIKEAMWKVDEFGSFQFSDATYNPLQPMLFKKEPNYFLLKGLILKEFKDKIVSVRELEDFILIKTSFRETHYKRQILAPMEKANPPEIEIIDCDSKRRKGTFPPYCILKFL